MPLLFSSIGHQPTQRNTQKTEFPVTSSVFQVLKNRLPARCQVSSNASIDAIKENEKLLDTPPICFENFGREWQSISGQDNFDGFRLEASKHVNKYMQASHSFFLGTQMREGGCFYQFGPTLIIPGDDSKSPEQGGIPSFFAMSKISSDGTVQGRIMKQLCPWLDLKFNFNSSIQEEQRNMYEFSFDTTGVDWTSSLKFAWQSCWIFNAMYSQVITPKLQVGGEITYVGANGASMTAVGARYNFDGNNVVHCQLSQQPDFKSPTGFTNDTHSCKIQYVRKVNDRVSLGTEWEYSPHDLHSSLKLGWEYLFRQARVEGLIDSGGKVSVFAQDYSGFGISGMIDYWRGDYKFGFVMHVLPPPDPQASDKPAMY